MKRVAAIDFGSNAVRLVLADIAAKGKYKVLEKFRFPVKIGTEVFSSGDISSNKQDEIYEVFRKFRSHIRYYHAEEVSAVATSALRDAKNSALVIKNIADVSGIELKLISGIEEANLICTILSTELSINKGATLLIDIGGGSTELIFLKDGKIEKLESFNNGTLRPTKDGDALLIQMKDLIKSTFSKGEKITVVGTGGNLRRLGKIRKKFLGKEVGTVINKDEALYIYKELSALSVPQIVKKFDLKEERAEVIVPALKIFTSMLEVIEPENIYLPKLGLSDSLLYQMSL